MPFTLKEVADFCWTNKKRRAFKDMTYEMVSWIVVHSYKTKRLTLVEDDEGLCGVLIMRVEDSELFVDYLVAIRNGFPTFIKFYEDNFPGFTIKGSRDGKPVTFNSRILCQHLHRITQPQTADNLALT